MEIWIQNTGVYRISNKEFYEDIARGGNDYYGTTYGHNHGLPTEPPLYIKRKKKRKIR
ncbi:MAG: hypothetical protein KAW92_12610 [Candidatus Cloacimonetes bacterium]|nr:hypothetical protein [Candidatus Cloacimonadota bacterium]